MILGKEFRVKADAATPTMNSLLDALAAKRPHDIALRDAPNRPSVLGGNSSSLTFQALAEQVDKLANQLIALGLTTDSVVALHLPVSSEAVIALLAVQKAGMIAAPLPLGWGRREVVAQLQRVAARGIITMSRTGSIDTADMMRHAAAMVFSVRLVCAYGQPVLDGVMPLDEMLADKEVPLPVVIERTGEASQHVAIVSADLEPTGHIAVARNHQHWHAAGTAFAAALELEENARFAACMSCDTLAGIASQIMPWLMAGCIMEMHPPFAARVFQTALKQGDITHCVLPVKAAAVLLEMETIPLKRAVLIARNAEDIAIAARLMEQSDLFRCLFVAGEAAACEITKGSGALVPSPSLQMKITAKQTLAFSGDMVPRFAFPPGAERAATGIWVTDEDGFADSGFPAQVKDQKFILSGNPTGIIAVGGRRFSESEITAVYVEAGGEMRPVIKPDVVMGQKVAGVIGHGRGIAGLAGRLERSGLSPLAIPGAARYGGQIPFEDTTPPVALEQTDEQRAHIIKQLLAG